MDREQTWDFIKKSEKTRFCNTPGFLLDLETGLVTEDSDKLVEAIFLPTVVMEGYHEMPFLYEQHDYIYVIDDIDKTLDIVKEVQNDRFPGMSLSFSTNTFRYRGFRQYQIDEMRNKLIEKNKNIAKCMASK